MEAFVHVSTRSISLRHIKMHQIISYYYISLSTNAIIPTGKLCHDEWEGRVPCNLHERTDIVPFLSLFFTSTLAMFNSCSVSPLHMALSICHHREISLGWLQRELGISGS